MLMKIKPDIENQLLTDLTKGSQEAFDAIYKIYWEQFYAFALRISDSEVEAQDLVQDVFVDLWVRREKLIISTSLKSYLFSMIKNKFLDKVRREKRFEHYADLLLAQTLNYDITPEDKYILEEKKTYLLEKVNTLPEKCREIFILNKIEGKSISEIADSLLISPQTVKNQLTKATKFIKPYQQEILASSVSLLWFIQNW